MIWPILCVVIFLLFVIYCCDWLGGFEKFMFFSIFSLVVWLGAYLVTGLICACILEPWTETWEESDRVKLVSLRDQGNVQGSSFLGSGTVGTTDYYYFYKQIESGYQQDKIAISKDVTIFEWEKLPQGEQSFGELKVYTTKFTHPVEARSLFWINFSPLSRKKYEFFIPQGSFKKGFALQ